MDHHIGKTLRNLRINIGLSQVKLGEALGVTFQQIQKYEKGVNRIGAARLQNIANILRVPIGYFYPSSQLENNSAVPELEKISALLDEEEVIRLIKAFFCNKGSWR